MKVLANDGMETDGIACFEEAGFSVDVRPAVALHE